MCIGGSSAAFGVPTKPIEMERILVSCRTHRRWKNPQGGRQEEHKNSTMPRKVHHRNRWKISQDVVMAIGFGRAQGKGLQFWQAPSHGVTLYDSVSADCIE